MTWWLILLLEECFCCASLWFCVNLYLWYLYQTMSSRLASRQLYCFLYICFSSSPDWDIERHTCRLWPRVSQSKKVNKPSQRERLQVELDTSVPTPGMSVWSRLAHSQCAVHSEHKKMWEMCALAEGTVGGVLVFRHAGTACRVLPRATWRCARGTWGDEGRLGCRARRGSSGLYLRPLPRDKWGVEELFPMQCNSVKVRKRSLLEHSQCNPQNPHECFSCLGLLEKWWSTASHPKVYSWLVRLITLTMSVQSCYWSLTLIIKFSDYLYYLVKLFVVGSEATLCKTVTPLNSRPVRALLYLHQYTNECVWQDGIQLLKASSLSFYLYKSLLKLQRQITCHWVSECQETSLNPVYP